MNQRFVFEGVEVVKTGRTATREVKTTPSRPPRQLILVEITPADPDSVAWRKWVDPTHLYVINPNT